MSEEKNIQTPACPVCKEQSYVNVRVSGYDAWKYGGQFIQRALPELSDDDRELLLTGTHPQCWDKLFPTEEQNGENDYYYNEDDEEYDPRTGEDY